MVLGCSKLFAAVTPNLQGHYTVFETDLPDFWPKGAEFFVSESKSLNSEKHFTISNISRMNLSFTGVLEGNYLKIPRQETHGNSSNLATSDDPIKCNGSGQIQDKVLLLNYVFITKERVYMGYIRAYAKDLIQPPPYNRDTTISGKAYDWINYDLNGYPREIGEDYTNGIKNGHWILCDPQGRAVQLGSYKNDTLLGMVVFYNYLGASQAIKSTGLWLNNLKQGEWQVFSRSKNGKWKISATQFHSSQGNIIQTTLFSDKGTKRNRFLYNAIGEAIWEYEWNAKEELIYNGPPQGPKLETLELTN